MKNLFAIILFAMISNLSLAQSEKTKKQLLYSNKFTLGSDLMQPFLLGGFNINATYTTNRWIFDYSHGMGLEIKEFLLTDEYKELDSNIKLPWTTGPGVGYRFTDNLDVRVDIKAHRTEVELLNGEQKLNYTQYTFGPGAFYRFYLGKNSGFGLEASARYWFDLGNNMDNLDGDDFIFIDSQGTNRKFNTNISSGVGVNIALIYTFGRNK